MTEFFQDVNQGIKFFEEGYTSYDTVESWFKEKK